MIVALLPIMLIMVFASAQPAASYRFKTISINEGLSQGFVSDITQDKKGLMWFTTADGLNQFDGYSCRVFHHELEDSTSIASDDLTCVFEDAQQRLWIGTRNDGLDLFNRSSHSFIHFRQGAINSIRSNKILGICEDRSGTLWIRTAAGIDRLDITHDAASGEASYRFTPVVTGEQPSEAADGIFIDSRNRIFITTTSKILQLITINAKGEYRLAERFRFSTGIPFFVPEIMEDTIHHSLLLNTGDIIRFPDYNFAYPQQLYHSQRTDISWTMDKQQRLWLAGIGEIIRIDLKSGETHAIVPSDPSQLKAISSPTRYYTDRTGVVWLGSGGYGLVVYDPEIEKFRNILEGETIYQLLELQPGKLFTNHFVSIDMGGASTVIDSSAARVLRRNRLFHDAPLTLAKDSTGNIWYGGDNKLVQYNFRTKQTREVFIPFTDVSSVPYPVYADEANNIWMGYKNWLVRYHITSGTFNRYPYPEPESSYSYSFLQTIFQDGNLLWLGTVKGLFCLDMEKGQMKQPYLFNQRDSTSISNNAVLSFCQDVTDPARYLWVGTKGGLNKLDKFTGKFNRFTTKNGLPNNVVYGMVADYEQNLWLSTNKGIAALHVPTQTCRNFDVSDGLQSNEFNRYGFTRTATGLIAFAGMNGITVFNPADIRPLPSPSVVLTELRLFNKVAQPLTAYFPLQQHIDFAKQLELTYEQNVITFRFAAMDYRRHTAVNYRYRLEGFDKDWIYAGNLNEATYTNLDAGEYHLMVESGFNGTNWSGQPKTLRIFVLAPWWQTWWFKMFVIIGTVSVAYVLYRYRIHQLTKLEGLRNRIARDLHDEVGSSISTIAIYSKIMHEQMENKTFNNETLLQKISEHATEIMESMNDIIWNINTKNDAFENIINRMREHAFQLLEAKGYLLHFNFDENLMQMQLPMEKRRDLYLIYKEALNNIAKYAGGQNVWITMTVENAALRLIIKDDGKGFDLTGRGKAGNGVPNMQHRAKMLGGTLNIMSTPGEGTEIRLTF